MPDRTATGKWKTKRRIMIVRARRAGTLQCHWCHIALDDSAPPHGPRSIELDHILAVVNGGTDNDDNLALTCHPCNRRKNKYPTPYGRTLGAGHDGHGDCSDWSVLRRSGSLIR